MFSCSSNTVIIRFSSGGRAYSKLKVQKGGLFERGAYLKVNFSEWGLFDMQNMFKKDLSPKKTYQTFKLTVR